MAVGKSTRKIQLGPEGTAGTLAAATYIWRGPAVGFKDTRKIERIPEDVGIVVPTSRSATHFLGGELAMPSQVATVEGISRVMNASIKKVTAGSSDGAGSGKIRAFTEPTSSTKNTIQTYSIESGDAQQAEVGEYGFCEEWELSGQKDGMVMLNGAKWRVRQVTNQAFTGALSLVAEHALPFNKATLYIDDTGGTLGNTQKTSTFVRFSLKKSGGWKPLPCGGDGNLYYVGIDYSDPKYSLDVTFLHDSKSVSAKTKWRAETAALIRMKFLGDALASAGTTHSYFTTMVDLAGKWLEFDVIGEQDGFQICTGKFEGMLDSTAGLFCNVTTVDEVSSLV